MSSQPKVALIGAGALGGALASGLPAAGFIPAESLWIAEQSEKRRAELRDELGLPHVVADNREAVEAADYVVLAVKPHIITTVLEEIADLIGPQRPVISLAAAVPIILIEEELQEGAPVIRAMPNIAMTVHASATGVCANEHTTEEQKEFALALFNSVGVAELVHEGQMHAVTALSGSGPAYVFLIAEAMAAGGVKTGLAPATAHRLAAQTLLGAAKLLIETGKHPGALRDQVTTPGGTTIAGLHELEAGGVRAALMSGVESAADRSMELAELLGSDR